MPRTKISVFPPTAVAVHGDVNWTRQPMHTLDSTLRRLALAIALPFTPWRLQAPGFTSAADPQRVGQDGQLATTPDERGAAYA